MSETKTGRAQIKAADDSQGVVTALVAVFDVVDSYYDVLRKGAFTRTLAEWEESGDRIPVLWTHDKDDLDAYVGEVIKAEETDEGLLVDFKLDMGDPKAAKLYRMLKARRIREFSFGFFIREAADAEVDGQYVRELRDVELIEVSPTLVGANRSTRLVGVKSGEGVMPPVVSLAPADRALLQRLVKAWEGHAPAVPATPDEKDTPGGPGSGTLDGEAVEAAEKDDDAAASGDESTLEEPEGAKGGEPDGAAAAILSLWTTLDEIERN